MALEFISCPACGTKNGSQRSICLSCGADLADRESGEKQMSQPTSESLWRRAGRFTKNLIIRDYRMWVVVAVGIAFGFFIWPTPYRYDHMIRGGNSYPVRTNRLTGAADFLEWHGWLHLSAPTPPSPPASKAAQSAKSAFLPGGVGPFSCIPGVSYYEVELSDGSKYRIDCPG